MGQASCPTDAPVSYTHLDVYKRQAHGDCPEDAEALIALLNRNHPPKNIINACYEPMTGAHVGPGALALFFYGKKEFRQATK